MGEMISYHDEKFTWTKKIMYIPTKMAGVYWSNLFEDTVHIVLTKA